MCEGVDVVVAAGGVAVDGDAVVSRVVVGVDASRHCFTTVDGRCCCC